MNHHEQHRKDREHEKEEHHHRHPEKDKGDLISIHPKWLFYVGVVLTLIALAIWSLIYYFN